MERVEKVCYRLPMGPQHPMFVEAENLIVRVDGETIVDLDLNVGYLHRGIETLSENRNWVQNIYLFERVCGICSGVHTITYCSMVEELLGLEIPERAKYVRTVIGELERIHSHFLMLGVAGYEMGLDTVFMYVWKDREHVMDILEKISGNRVNYAMNTIGGVRRDVPEGAIPDMLKKLDYLDKRVDYYVRIFSQDRMILNRSRDVGILQKKDVGKFSIVGPVARASGINYDVRRARPYAAYDDVHWSVITSGEGDALERFMVKIRELSQSISIIRQCLHRLKKLGDRDLKVRAPFMVPENEAVAVAEAPRGELIYYGKSNGTDKPERIKMRTPSYANLLSYRPVLLGQHLADLPLIIASTDPCFSCCDRVTLVDVNNEETTNVDANYLRRMRK
jgi:Ni,Fe-hydrogenase III large subunit